MTDDSSHITEIVSPADQAAVAEAIRSAADRGLAVYPVGGGTSSARGAKPARPGIGLSLAKLNRVIDYPADDLTITVEAGMTVAELHNSLAAKRQRLPVDVPHPDRATVGGAVAGGAGGPRRYAYGAMRDYLLGFTAIDGAGRAFSGGGRVVKNAAGYNMCRLMAGALGALGVLTQVTLMVRPMCETSAILACDLPNFELVEHLLAGLVRSAVRPVAVELLAGRPREDNPVLGPRLDGSAARLYVGFEGLAAEVEWMTGLLRTEWLAAGVATPILASAPAVEQQWRWLAEAPTDAMIDVLPGKVARTVERLLDRCPGCSIHAHAGDGTIRVAAPPDGFGDEGFWAGMVPADATDLSPVLRIMRAIKERFDPQNVLNPGVEFFRRR